MMTFPSKTERSINLNFLCIVDPIGCQIGFGKLTVGSESAKIGIGANQ